MNILKTVLIAGIFVSGLFSQTDWPVYGHDASGQRYVLTAGVFFAINQGKIARVTPYYNQNDRRSQIARALGG